MHEHLNHERKVKNWKILNQNFIETQEQNPLNRSTMAQQPKKYCPRKNVSKQKIFSKSKERFNIIGIQNTNSNSSHLNGTLRDTGNKINSKIHIQDPPSKKDQKDQEVQTSKMIENAFQHKTKQFALKNHLIAQENQSVHRNNLNVGSINRYNNHQGQQDMNEKKFQHHSFQQNMNHKQHQRSINSTIIRIKEQFENFKSSIIAELNQQKMFLRNTVQQVLQILGKMHNDTEKASNDVVEIQSSQKQMKNISTNIRLQKLLKLRNPQVQPFISLLNQNYNKMQSYGTFKQPISSRLNQKQMINLQKSDTIKETSNIISESQEVDSICQQFINSQEPSYQVTQSQMKRSLEGLNGQNQGLNQSSSTDNFYIQNSQYPIEPPFGSLIQDSKSNYYKNLRKIGTSDKNMFQLNDQNRRYSDVFKKEYKLKCKKIENKTIDQDKINSKVQYLQKFNGAMQKLKSNLQEFKSISDTKEIMKIKFFQQKSLQHQINQLCPNSIHSQLKSSNSEVSASI